MARSRDAVMVRVRAALRLLRWVALGAASGLLAGAASYVLLVSLDRATRFRLGNPWIVLLLPAAAGVVGLVYHRWGGRSSRGNALLLEEIHTPTTWVPRRMAPLILLGTVATHVFGGSVGREGSALQMSGSLTDALSRLLRLTPADRRLLLIAALAGGFGAVFGVPWAGAVFAWEVQAVRVRHQALVPALAASLVGDLVVRGLGYEHAPMPRVDLPVDAALVAKVAVAGVIFGLASWWFTWLTRRLRGLAALVAWAPLRPAIGGVATLGLVVLFGRDYLGLSLPIIEATLDGHDPGISAFALKTVFTAVALGSGMPGGEVTPLFVVGAALGGALAGPLGIPVAALGAVGFVAVFAGAANAPLACAVMGAELFGAEAALVMAVGCLAAHVSSGHHGIYSTPHLDIPHGRRRP